MKTYRFKELKEKCLENNTLPSKEIGAKDSVMYGSKRFSANEADNLMIGYLSIDENKRKRNLKKMKNIIQSKNISASLFAEKVGINRHRVHSILNGGSKSASGEEIDNLSYGLGVERSFFDNVLIDLGYSSRKSVPIESRKNPASSRKKLLRSNNISIFEDSNSFYVLNKKNNQLSIKKTNNLFDENQKSQKIEGIFSKNQLLFIDNDKIFLVDQENNEVKERNVSEI